MIRRAWRNRKRVFLCEDKRPENGAHLLPPRVQYSLYPGSTVKESFTRTVNISRGGQRSSTEHRNGAPEEVPTVKLRSRFYEHSYRREKANRVTNRLKKPRFLLKLRYTRQNFTFHEITCEVMLCVTRLAFPSYDITIMVPYNDRIVRVHR